MQLLNEYYRVENQFQGNMHTLCIECIHYIMCLDGYDKGVMRLREEHGEDTAMIATDIFAHYYIAGRNTLAIMLIVRSCAIFYFLIDFYASFRRQWPLKSPTISVVS